MLAGGKPTSGPPEADETTGGTVVGGGAGQGSSRQQQPVAPVAKASDHRKRQPGGMAAQSASAAPLGAIGRRFRGRDGRAAPSGGENNSRLIVQQVGHSGDHHIGRNHQSVSSAKNLQEQQQQQQHQQQQVEAIDGRGSQSKSSNLNGNTTIAANNLTEISSKESTNIKLTTNLTTSNHHHHHIAPIKTLSSHQKQEQVEGPLIHTEKLNASSPLLYVFHSPQATKQHPRLGGNPIDSMGSESHPSNQVVSSPFAPSRTAILSAVGKRAIGDGDETTTVRQRLIKQEQPYANEASQAVVPRLVVLNLEVGNSTATLAWSLSLIPSDNTILTPSASSHQPVSYASSDGANKNSDKKKELLEQQAHPVQQHQHQQQVDATDEDKRAEEGGGQVSSKVKGANSSRNISSLPSEGRVALSQYQQQPPTVTGNRTNDHDSRAGGESNRVKRDTIKVVPTLGRVEPSEADFSNKGNSTTRYERAMDQLAGEESGDENNEDAELPDKREMSSSGGNMTSVAGGDPQPTGAIVTTGVRQTIDSSSDLLRISNNNSILEQQQQQRATTSRPQTILTSASAATTTIRPSNVGGLQLSEPTQLLGPDLSVGTRLQLSRIQTLPASTNNRRPPMRLLARPDNQTTALSSTNLSAKSRLPSSENLLPRSGDDLQSSSGSTRAQLDPSQRDSSTTGQPALSTAASASMPPPSSSSSETPRRQTTRPTTVGLFLGRRKSMLNRSDGLATSSNSVTTTPAPTAHQTTAPKSTSAHQRSALNDASSIIRSVSVPLNRIPTSTSTTTTTTSTTSAASPDAETTSELATTTSVPITSAPTTTTRKPQLPVSTEPQRAAKSLSEFTQTVTDSSSSPTPLVTESSSLLGSSSNVIMTENATKNNGESSTKSQPQSRPTPEVVTTHQPASSSSSTEEPQVQVSAEKSILINHSTTQQPADKRPPTTVSPEPAEASKWLIRLRRFATNEVDIVKVVVNNLRQFAQQQQQNQHQQHPALRYILFKNLEPSSAYEICIESASPNQQVEDRFKILDANHFLKCHDTNDVELSNSSEQNNATTSIRRMDLNHVTKFDAPVASPNHHNLASELDQLDPAMADGNGQVAKLKSLCKEFFTLPPNSTDKINYGHFEGFKVNNAFESSAASSVVSRKVKAPQSTNSTGPFVDLSLNFTTMASNHTTTTLPTTNLTGNNLRRPKSLQNSLKSHMELLEINDLGSSLGGSRDSATGSNMFEILASRNPQSTLNSRLSSLASSSSSTTTSASIGQNINQPSNNINRSHGSSASDNKILPMNPSLAPNQDYLNLSVLPIVGCVFALIFIITLANIVLSAINCQSKLNSSRRRQRDHRNARTDPTRLGGGSGGGLLINGRDGLDTRQHALGSFYSDHSDHSGTSQSRIVVVGKNHEPFTAASAYFELPEERNLRPGSELGPHPAHSPLGSGGKLSASSYLLSSASRFPLGPSFEGDERHNADMVGLARKNYDNFINHIYNADLVETPMEVLSSEQPASRTLSTPPGSQHHHSRGTAASHHHGTSRGGGGHYHRHRRHPSREFDPYRLSDTSHAASGDRAPAINSGSNSGDSGSGGGGNNTNNRKQRLRYDKINPIYNMNGLQYNSPTRVRVRSPMVGGISSFGHTNNNLTGATGSEEAAAAASRQPRLADGDPKQQQVQAESDEQCPLCEPPEAHIVQSEQLEFDEDDDDDDSQCDGGKNCDGVENSSMNHFSCCLDRQKQRFEKQQQQLERVMTRNGSLVPQPFINPTGPPRCGSPSCQAVSHDHDMLVAASGATGKNGNVQDVSIVTNTSDGSESDEMLVGNNIGESQSILTRVNDEADESKMESSQKPNDYFLFGEGNLQHERQGQQQQSIPNDHSSFAREHVEFPPPPPPPAPPVVVDTDVGYSATTTGGESGAGSKNLVKLGTMSPAGGSSAAASIGNNANETINKTDFNQRRNELASKLHLAGMIVK